MKVLFLDAYFEPEQIAFTHLENDLLEGLANAGHDVEIICPTPTRGVSKDVVQEYRHKKREDLYDGHVHVTRFSALQEGKSPLVRALRYFWCNYRTYQIGKKKKNIDVVFANSTPPTQGWVAGKVAKKLNSPFVYSVQDIFPDSLITTGLTKKDSFLWKIGRRLENATYKHCSKIIVISEAMKDNLLQKGVAQDKTQVISNWVDLNAIHPIPRESNRLFDELKISREKFIVLYAGNIGAAQGAEIIIDAAEQVRNTENIQFVIFGGGPMYQDMVIRSKKLPNVFIHQLMPQDKISEVYSMGNVALITCKKGVGKSGMPSKTWSIMACNTPIIASFDLESEMNIILFSSQAGKCVEAENSNLLSKEIMTFYNYYLNGNNDYNNGREYVLNNCSKKLCVMQYISEMRQACEGIND